MKVIGIKWKIFYKFNVCKDESGVGCYFTIEVIRRR